MAEAKAFHVFSLDHPHVARTLKAKLEQRFAELSGHLAAGNAEDWADYKERVGRIQGLRDAISMCEDAEMDLGD